MSAVRSSFYERYWSGPGKAVPEDDTTTQRRKSLLERALQEFLPADGARRNRKVLDAGCGDGEFVAFIQSLGFEAVGMDISRAAIERARGNHPGTEYYVGSVEETWPFTDGGLDAVWSSEVLEHLFDVHACLSECNRVLRVGGVLALTAPFHGYLKNLAIALAGFEKHYDPYLSHIRFFTRKSLSLCLRRAGFEPLLWRGIGRFWPLYMSVFVVSRKVRVPEPAPEIAG